MLNIKSEEKTVVEVVSGLSTSMYKCLYLSEYGVLFAEVKLYYY
jgi:hypothetical protein